MSMESKERMSQDFAQCYGQICASLGLTPLTCITAYSKIRTLSFNADKIGSNEWVPVLNSLKINEALETIIIRSYANTSDISKNGKLKKPPSIKSEELVTRLCKSVEGCLMVNSRIKVLNLVGLNLKDFDVKILSKGLERNKSLTQISFEKSLKGANQFEDILQAIRTSMNISCVNFSGCHVDVKFAHLVADYIKCQMSVRHDQVWQDGLRYRRPALDSVGGLRRITINDNPDFGDEGVNILCSVIREDIWLKALDLQNCSITDEGGRRLLKVLELNASLVVVDARQNPDLGSDILQKIRHQCRINWGAQETEFKWLSVNESERKNIPPKRLKMTKSIRTPSTGVPSPHRAARSKGEVTNQRIPWRAASRALRVRNITPERKETSNNTNETGTPASNNHHHHHQLKTISHNELETQRQEKDEEIQNLKDQLSMLTEENNHLRKKNLEMEKKQMETEETLDIIENSFTNFHNFLDMLKQIGLGPLITFAKLNEEPTNWMPEIAKVDEIQANELKSRTSQETYLNTTDQMRSFLAERNFNPESLGVSEFHGKRLADNKKNFDELVNRAIRNGENLVKISTGNTSVKDLVDNITSSIGGDNIGSNTKDFVESNQKQFVKDIVAPGHETFNSIQQIRDELVRERQRLKSENSDYSSHFDAVSSSAGGDNIHAYQAGKIKSKYSFLPSMYLQADSEDESFSIGESRDISVDEISLGDV